MMMPLSAFHGNCALAQRSVARLQQRSHAGQLAPGPIAWDGTTGSIVGCVIESSELSRWETELGLPQWLAVLLDSLSWQFGSPAEVASYGIETLLTVRIGSDLQSAGSRFILHLLDDIDSEPGLQSSLLDCLTEVRTLHTRCLAGDVPEAARWRAVRKRAAAVTDAVPENIDQACGKCIETAAWNPITSSSTVYDTLREWRNLLTARAALAIGWDKAADMAMQALLDNVHERFIKGSADPQRTVFEVLAEKYPADDARLQRRLKADMDVYHFASRRARVLLTGTLYGVGSNRSSSALALEVAGATA